MKLLTFAVLAIMTVLATLMLSGCATVPMPQDGAQAVYAAEGSYAVALTAAAAYRRLPLCGPDVGPACHNVDVVEELVAADNKAYGLLTDAQKLVTVHGTASQIGAALALASAAIADFRSKAP